MSTYDLSIKHPFSMLIVGPSGSGKTMFVTKLLRNRAEMIDDAPKRVIWYYGAWQPLFDQLDYEFREGIPEVNDDSNYIMVVDDLMCEAQEQVSQVFTKYRHHSKISCIFLCQNLFPRGPYSRNISLNSNYIVLMKNSRDKAQINHLARQVYPGRSKILTQAFENATKDPFSYLFVDFAQTTPEELRLRTNIFPADGKITVYVPKL